MADDIPASYYHGRPMNHHADHRAPPPPQAEAVDEQVNAQVPGYYAGRVPGKNAVGDQSSAPPPPPPAAAPPAADQPSKETDCFTRCFGCCLFGGGTAR